MPNLNPTGRELSLKVAFYGPPLAGKGTALAYLHRALRAETRGQIVSITTGLDHTLFFDFFPQPRPRLRGNGLRLQIYATPGEVHGESAHRALLEDVKGIIFLADSQRAREQDNALALEQLRLTLHSLNLRLEQIPLVFAWNKRDLSPLLSAGELAARLNHERAPAFDTVATQGKGLFDVLKAITSLVIGDAPRRPGHNAGSTPAPARESPPRPAPAPIHLAETSIKTPAPPPETVVTTPSRGSDALVLLSADTALRRPTYLQPLAPELVEAVLAAEKRPLQLSLLLPVGPLRDQVHEVEQDLTAGQNAQAVRRARSIFVGLTALDAAREPDEGQAWRALVLGLPIHRYLRFREATRSADAGTASAEDGLYALFFLIDAMLHR